MIEQLRNLLERVEAWPAKAQEEAVASLEAIEETFFGAETLSPEDMEALERSAEDVRLERFASESEMRGLFDRYRAK